jgi:hypothetical protein
VSEIPLTGLAGDHPLGALAALGVLRCCDELDGFRGARLSWRRAGTWAAVLHTPADVTPDELVAALTTRQRGRDRRPELTWTDTLQVEPGVFLAAVRAAEDGLTAGSRDFADFLCAFGCELCMGKTGRLEPTAFYMTSGQQEFLKECRAVAYRLAAGVKVGRRTKAPADLFREALFGPWRYEDKKQHSLGLDPSTERLHALQAEKPKKGKNVGVTGAVGLAVEALPLFPCFLCGGRLATTGFHIRGATRQNRVKALTWPVWTSPLPLATVRSLLSLPALATERPPAEEVRAMGIAEVFRSERYKVKTQGNYHILRPAVPCL